MAIATTLSALTPLLGGQNGVFSFGNNLLLNKRESNAAGFALEQQKLQNDFNLSELERQSKLLVLQQQFAQVQAKIDDEERADQLKLVAIVGLFATLIIVLIVAFKQRPK